MSSSESVEAITLNGGPTVPLAALRLLLALEARGFAVAATDAGLRVSPRSEITAEDALAIRAHRDDLLALVRHCAQIQ